MFFNSVAIAFAIIVIAEANAYPSEYARILGQLAKYEPHAPPMTRHIRLNTLGVGGAFGVAKRNNQKDDFKQGQMRRGALDSMITGNGFGRSARRSFGLQDEAILDNLMRDTRNMDSLSAGSTFGASKRALESLRQSDSVDVEHRPLFHMKSMFIPNHSIASTSDENHQESDSNTQVFNPSHYIRK